MFIAHGKRDCVIPWYQSEELEAAVAAADVDSQLNLSETGVHDINTLGIRASDILSFIEDNVRCGD
jgi:predicted esterase